MSNEDSQEDFNPNRCQLSYLLNEYLNEVSPMTEWQISYDAAYKLIQKYVEGVTFHDVTRAVRYFSPTYMITFDNYIEILKIFLKSEEKYFAKVHHSIENVLFNIANDNSNVSNDLNEFINSLGAKCSDKDFNELPIINMIRKFIKFHDINSIKEIISKIEPNKNKKISEKIVVSPKPSRNDFKIYIHLLDLFNIKKCISFLDIFKKIDKYHKATFKIGFAVECQLRNNSKFSRIVLQKSLDVFKYNNIRNKINHNNSNSNNNNDDCHVYNENDYTNQDLEANYYRIDDTIILDFNYTVKEDKKELEKDENFFFELIMNSPLILKLYTVIIPNKVQTQPMKILYGYLKIPLVPILFAKGHEIQLSGNFIPLETAFNESHIKLLLEANNEETSNISNENEIITRTEDPVMLSFSLKADSDPFICFSKPFGSEITKIDDKYISQIRERTIMNSNSRSCQISAREEFEDKHHFLCFFVEANIEFDTDNLYDMLIRDARKPGTEYSSIIRSPFTLFYNQFTNLNPDSNYNDVFRIPYPYVNDPFFFFDRVIQPYDTITNDIKNNDDNKNNGNKNNNNSNKDNNNSNYDPSCIKYATKLTQLERCIILCNALLKNNIDSYVCCGSLDLCDTYCVVSMNDEKLTDGNGKHIHLIPGHVYPISLLQYSIKDNDDSPFLLSKSQNLKLNNLFDFNYNGSNKKYKSVHVWSLCEICNDAISASYHITTIFNNKNVWINRQKNDSILRINWDVDNKEDWFPVLKDNDSINISNNNNNNDSNSSSTLNPYVYSKRKVTFFESFDKIKYEYDFRYEFEQYTDEHSIQIDRNVHNFIVKNKKKLFNKNYIHHDLKYTSNTLSSISSNSISVEFEESDKRSFDRNEDMVRSETNSIEFTLNDDSSSIIHDDDIEMEEEDDDDDDEEKYDLYQEVEITKNDEKPKFFFFRRIEAPYFMMPDELLEYIIENNGLSFLKSFDIIIDFKPLPLNNCKINIIIAYGSDFIFDED